MSLWEKQNDGPEVKFTSRALYYGFQFKEVQRNQLGHQPHDNIYFYSTGCKAEWMNGDAPQTGPPQTMPTNLLLPTYVTFTPTDWSRIGNKINVVKMEINLLLTANYLTNNNQAIPIPVEPSGPSTIMILQSPPFQGGEAYATEFQQSSTSVYIRTTYRVMVIKDLKVNQNRTEVNWADVMQQETDPGSTNGGSMGGIMSYMKPSEWNRFEVLADETVELNAQNPQKIVTYTLGNKEVGSVRYTSTDALAPSNIGIHVIWCAQSVGVGYRGSFRVVNPTSPVLTRGLWFVDE